MKYLSFLQYTLLLILSSLLMSCISSDDKVDSEEIVRSYFDGLNNADFKSVRKCISDSIVMNEADKILTVTITDYYKIFQWDSVFMPHYQVDKYELSNGDISVVVSKTCKRIRFLQDSAIVYNQNIKFKDNKIARLDIRGYQVFDLKKWKKRRNSLVSWTKINHPELDGFIYDQTKNGAQNYLKAIEFYMKQR